MYVTRFASQFYLDFFCFFVWQYLEMEDLVGFTYKKDVNSAPFRNNPQVRGHVPKQEANPNKCTHEASVVALALASWLSSAMYLVGNCQD